MSAKWTCENCDAPLAGRRPDARFCSPACRRAGARRGEARRGSLAADPAENPAEATARRAHACEAALRHLEARLAELGPHLPTADCRLLARVMRDALRAAREDA